MDVKVKSQIHPSLPKCVFSLWNGKIKLQILFGIFILKDLAVNLRKLTSSGIAVKLCCKGK